MNLVIINTSNIINTSAMTADKLYCSYHFFTPFYISNAELYINLKLKPI